MRTELDLDNEAVFNDRAHETVRKLLDVAEDGMVRNGICEHYEVEDYLCRFYINEVASMLFGAISFMQSNANEGAESFLWKCRGDTGEKLHPMWRKLTATKLRACACQLSFHTMTYFRRYPAILTQCYTEELQAPDDKVLIGAGHNGIFHLAAASLPNVQANINRELRRRGLPYDATSVHATHLARRTRALGSHRGMIGKGAGGDCGQGHV